MDKRTPEFLEKEDLKFFRRLAREGDVFSRIVMAYTKNKGLRLTAEDVDVLINDRAMEYLFVAMVEEEVEPYTREEMGYGPS